MQQSLVAQLGEGGARHDPRRPTLARATPVALATNGTVRLARGLASMTKTWVGLDGELHVDRAPHVEGLGDGAGCSPR